MITNQLLYQLSYTGIAGLFEKAAIGDVSKLPDLYASGQSRWP
jgi:hypothetical protein